MFLKYNRLNIIKSSNFTISLRKEKWKSHINNKAKEMSELAVNIICSSLNNVTPGNFFNSSLTKHFDSNSIVKKCNELIKSIFIIFKKKYWCLHVTKKFKPVLPIWYYRGVSEKWSNKMGYWLKLHHYQTIIFLQMIPLLERTVKLLKILVRYSELMRIVFSHYTYTNEQIIKNIYALHLNQYFL